MADLPVLGARYGRSSAACGRSSRACMIVMRGGYMALLNSALVTTVVLLAAGIRDDGNAGKIRLLDPPEKGFFAKELDYKGIPIKASAEVEDRALVVARDRIDRLLKHLPNALYNLRVAGAEL